MTLFAHLLCLVRCADPVALSQASAAANGRAPWRSPSGGWRRSQLLPEVLGLLGGYDLTYGSLAGVMITLLFFFVVGLGRRRRRGIERGAGRNRGRPR